MTGARPTPAGRAEAAFGLVAPVAVFDSGLGSLTLVEALRARRPSADIIYFADRANFPYGRQTLDVLEAVTACSVEELARLGARHVVVGSNTPSVTVLGRVEADLRSRHPDLRVVGVLPPVAEACSVTAPDAGSVVVLGSALLVGSGALADFLARSAGVQAGRCQAVDAGALIDLVETGAFLDQPGRTAEVVERFVHQELAGGDGVAVVTLSSTHLRWLAGPLRAALPWATVLDPLDQVVDALAATLPRAGTGRTVAVATALGQDDGDVTRFAEMLGRLGVGGPLYPARWVPAAAALGARLEISSTSSTR